MYGDYPDLSFIKKILVVKLRHHGDVLLTSPFFSILKKNLPDAYIDAFVYKDTLPMLEGHPAITQFFSYDQSLKKLPFFKKIYKESALLWKIRQKNYDLVINLTEGDRGAIVAWVSGALYRVGFDPENKGMKGKKNIYTHVVKNCKTPRHTVEKHIDVLRRIGIFPSDEERNLFLHIPETARLSIREKLQGITDFVVIHPASRWRFKCLPVKKMAELIDALAAREIPIVLSSGPCPEEIEMNQSIKDLVPHARILDLSGKMTLKELAALIEASRCLICVDSVPLHIASATKTPVVALFGPTSEFNWGPWKHCKSRVITKPFPCRPCNRDGCGGGKISDCLVQLPLASILDAFDDLYKRKFSPK